MKKDLILFLEPFTIAYSGGMCLQETISLCEKSTQSPPFKRALIALNEDIGTGMLLSDGMKQHPKIFPCDLVADIRMGEETGDLGYFAKKYLENLKKEEQLKNKLTYASSLFYFLTLSTLALLPSPLKKH